MSDLESTLFSHVVPVPKGPPHQYVVGRTGQGVLALDLSNESKHPPEIMNLAHPLRLNKIHWHFYEMLPEFLGPHEWKMLGLALKTTKYQMSHTMQRLVDAKMMPQLMELFIRMGGVPGQMFNGQMYGMLNWLRTIVGTCAFFRLEDDLVTMLMRTDLADDVPVSLLEPPYPCCYVELGQRRDLPLHIFHEMTGLHHLEGAYVTTGVGIDHRKGISLLLTGSPVGKSGNAGDDATLLMWISTEDPDRPISEVLHEELVKLEEENGDANTAKGQFAVNFLKHEPVVLAAIKMLIKSLLYMSSSEMRVTRVTEKTDLLNQAKTTKNPVKRRKIEARAAKSQDYSIVIAPKVVYNVAELPEGHETMTDEERRSVSPHWRRGHFRMQAFGKNRAERKRIRIPPLWIRGVNGPLLPDVAIRDYDVK